MRTAALLFVLAASVSSAAHAGGEFILFAQTADLSEAQSDILENLDDDPTTGEIGVIQANTEALSVINGEVTMTLGVGAVATFPAERQSLGEVEDGPAEGPSFAWSADTAEGAAGDVASVAVVDGEVTGTVQIGQATFAFYSLGGGLTAVVQETADVPPDHPPELPEGALNTDVSDVNPDDLRDEADVQVARISVLVVATPAAKANFSSLPSVAEAAIEISNKSFENSGVNVRFELAGTMLAPGYQEEGSHEGDLSRLVLTGDGFLDDVHAERQQKKADLVIMLIKDPEYCGLAQKIYANKASAFAVVHWSCSVTNLSFPHELGHLLGACHDPSASAGCVFSYGHGFTDPVKHVRTVMGYDCAGGCARKPQWARPPDWGNATKSHDARVLNETSTRAAGFF